MRVPRTARAKPEAKSSPDKPATTRGRPRSGRTPDIEIVLGARIRAARISAGLSQTALGAAVGISFQQIQKYEKGLDRIAASTLQGLATTLGVHPGSFYDDVPLPTGKIAEVKTALKIANIAKRIDNPPVLRRIIALMEHFALPEDGPEARIADGRGTVDDKGVP